MAPVTLVVTKRKGFVAKLMGTVWKKGKEDPRRVIHAAKVGLALTMASLLCLLEPLSEGIGQNAIWAVLTVVVVLEFTAGATLWKGLNRGMGTVLVGLTICDFRRLLCRGSALAQGRAVFIGSAVFLFGTAATFALYVSWELRHICRGYRSMWWQYANLGAALRHFGYSVVALNGCLHTEIKATLSVRGLFRDECVRLAGKVSRVLMDLAAAVSRQFHAETLSRDLHLALQELNASLQSRRALLKAKLPDGCPENQNVQRPQLRELIIDVVGFSETIPFAAFVSLLVEAIARLEHVIKETKEIGRIDHFKVFKAEDQNITVKCETKIIHIPTQGTE